MLRRLFLRARVFASEGYSAGEVRSILDSLERELKETSTEKEVELAMESLRSLVQRDEGSIRR